MSNNQLCDLDFMGRGAYVAKGTTALADALRINGGLTSVSLLGNNLNKKAAQMLLQIKAEKPNLRTLCGLTHDETQLNYGNRGLGAADAMLLAQEIAVMGGLTTLSLAVNSLGEAGTKSICEAQKINSTVTELHLQGCPGKSNIGGTRGARHVADMLAVNRGLTSLDVRYNRIDDEVMDMIRKAGGRKGFALRDEGFAF